MVNGIGNIFSPNWLLNNLRASPFGRSMYSRQLGAGLTPAWNPYGWEMGAVQAPASAPSVNPYAMYGQQLPGGLTPTWGMQAPQSLGFGVLPEKIYRRGVK